MNDELTPFKLALGRWGARMGVRAIGPGDERAFAAPAPEALARRRASGAARIVARALLGEWGADAAAPLVRSPGRFAVWPRGFVGSLAHDSGFATAAIARAGAVAGIGIDIEPSEPLPEEVDEIALSPDERRGIGGNRTLARLVFCAKEAVYKAINPYDETSLEYDQIEVSLRHGAARLFDGRRLELATFAGSRLLAAAISPARATAP